RSGESGDIGEELLVIECGAGVQPGSGSFTGGGVRRVDEHRRSWMRTNRLEGVALLETDPIAEGSDGIETLDESFGVPSDANPRPASPVFTRPAPGAMMPPR